MPIQSGATICYQADGRLYALHPRSGAGKDALQETFINAFKYIQSYSGKGSFEGWLRRIAVNCSLKVIKTMYEGPYPRRSRH